MRIKQETVTEQMDRADRIKETDNMLKQIDQLTKERDRLKDAAYQYIETLSECVSDQIDPSVNVGWMRMSPKLPEYVQAVEKERDQLAAKCEQLANLNKVQAGIIFEQQSKCAEMRNAIQLFVDWCATPDQVVTPEVIEAQHDALSDQCGVGWLSPEKKKQLENLHSHALLRIAKLVSREKVLVEVLDEVMKEHSATMREVSEIGYSEGLCLNPSLYLKAKQALEACK